MYQGSPGHCRYTYVLVSKTVILDAPHLFQWQLFWKKNDPMHFCLKIYPLDLRYATYVKCEPHDWENAHWKTALFSWILKRMVVKESETWAQDLAVPRVSKSQNQLPWAFLPLPIKRKLHCLLYYKLWWGSSKIVEHQETHIRMFH